MTYKVVLTHTDEGYSVSCPTLPGCWSEGDSEAEALENIQSAISEYLVVIAEMHAVRIFAKSKWPDLWAN